MWGLTKAWSKGCCQTQRHSTQIDYWQKDHSLHHEPARYQHRGHANYNTHTVHTHTHTQLTLALNFTLWAAKIMGWFWGGGEASYPPWNNRLLIIVGEGTPLLYSQGPVHHASFIILWPPPLQTLWYNQSWPLMLTEDRIFSVQVSSQTISQYPMAPVLL